MFQGDTTSYIEAINFLSGALEPSGLIFNRLITTFGGLQFIILLEPILGLFGAWIFMNSIFYILICFVFYKIILTLFESRKTAILATLFLASNYAMLRFGLAYLMDIGGWAFYLISIYFTLRYIKYIYQRDLLLASFAVGIGGLFKEYAFLAIIPIAAILVYENRSSLLNLVKNSFTPALLAVGPIILVYVWAYFQFDYTYLDWLRVNQTYYLYNSRIVEYIKSLGSLLNVLGILFLGGLLVLWAEWTNIDSRIKLFLLSIFASFLPILFWPAITQRILFITAPFVIIVSSFLFKKYQKYWYVFIPVLLFYILINFFMDSHILPNVNLPI